MSIEQDELSGLLRKFKTEVWPVYVRHGWKNIDLAFHSHLMLQQVRKAEGLAATKLDVVKAKGGPPNA